MDDCKRRFAILACGLWLAVIRQAAPAQVQCPGPADLEWGALFDRQGAGTARMASRRCVPQFDAAIGQGGVVLDCRARTVA